MTIQEQLSRFAYDINYKKLSGNVILRTKYAFLDTLGAILAGSTTSIAHQYYSFIKEIGGVKESIMIGDGCLVPAIWAATINGTIGHVHEIDDGDRFALGHPGIITVPAALAVGEKEGSKGQDVLTAIVLGYDIFSRIARGINPSHRDRGFHTTATCGTYGAAIVAGKLMELDPCQFSSALGIAGIQAAGLGSGRGNSMLKPIGVGKSSGDGILAAMLAKTEIPTSPSIIDGERGFAAAHSDSYNIDIMSKDLGKHFKILDSYIKFHASCRHTHPSIDAALELKMKYNIEPNIIKEILVKTYDIAAKMGLDPSKYHPPSPHAAKFSLPYVIAVALIEGKVDIDSFSMEKIKDPFILETANKVKVVEDKEMSKKVPNKRGSSLNIITTDERVFSSTIENPVGEPENLNFKKVEDKFYSLATRAISIEKAKDLYKMVMNLDKIKDVTVFRGLLV